MIEIIPKPTTKKFSWQNFLFYLSIALMIAAILGYFILNNIFKKTIQTFNDLDEKLAKLKTPEELNLEKEVLNYSKKIKDFSILINNHLAVSNSFNLLEKLTHPRVWFFDIEVNSKDAKISLSGEAEDFPALGQQLLIFKKEKRIQNVELSKVSLAEGGRIKFELNLSLSPEIFIPFRD
jgi:hypothetical protein